jgi:glycosyltransferase involved in cell wall biosynthesis
VPPAEPPLVSIVTPSLNQGQFIEEAILSVREQDYQRIEHIVFDGGSTDQTLGVLARYPHLRWVSEPDQGQADAVNKGFAMARGEIFGWLNADDYYLSGAVTAAVALMREIGCGLVHGGWRQIDESGATIGDVAAVPFDYRRQLEVENRVAQPGAFFSREAFEAVGGLDLSYRYAMDYELWLKLGARFEVRHVDRVQAAYRYHPVSKSVADYEEFWPETRRASREHGGRFFSPMYTDYYLPKYRPHLFRLLLAMRLMRVGAFRRLGARVARRIPTSRRGGRSQ